ncbi:MAG: hypothetical protein HZA50_19395 [Planctomycetes bacterium]|nr:hypothetical protein [Planctomycetota bacterium]
MYMWEVEFTDEFDLWWDTLSLTEQAAIEAGIQLLERLGPLLSRPYADTVKGSRHSNMKELSTPPQKFGADNHAARASWHFAITLSREFMDHLNG